MTTTAERNQSAAVLDHAEAPLTLEEPAPRALRLIDQLGLWGNLGVSLLGFTGALWVLYPSKGALTISAALVAIVLGTALGTAAVSAAGVAGTQTGAPAMVVLRGLLGAKLSWLPTVLNIVQLLGWTIFELVVISTALHQMAGDIPRSAYVVMGGVVTTALALYPLSWIRVLRRYVTVLVVIALGYVGIQMLRNPVSDPKGASWHEFWLAVDTVVAVAISFAPVAADYTRHSKRVRDTVIGSFVGYSVTQIACYAIGLVALLSVAKSGTNHAMFAAFLAIPFGTLAFAVLAVREVDQSFVDTYSTAVSVQNLRPRWDRRILALLLGVLATVLALLLNINDYVNFLVLLGSVFVPLFGVFVVDFFGRSRASWDLSETAPTRWLMLLPWLLGFVAYQLVNPGYVGWWRHLWRRHIDEWLGFTPTSWMSASIISFGVAALATVPLVLLRRREETRADPSGSLGRTG